MEQKFTCSKLALKKARICFWFYIVGALLIAALFFLPFIFGKNNRIDWLAVIYLLIEIYLAYSAYRAYCVIRALRNSFCELNNEIVSGISIIDPYQKGIPFQIEKTQITGIEEKAVVSVKKEELSYSPRLHRPQFSSPYIYRYPSVVIRTKDNVNYTLFGIELTDEIKKKLTY